MNQESMPKMIRRALLMAGLSFVLGVFYLSIVLDKDGLFNAVMLWIIFRYALLWLSGLLLVFRLAGALKRPKNIIYTLVTVMDILFGLAALAMFIFHKANLWWLSQCLVNWLVGLVMLGDIAWPRRR